MNSSSDHNKEYLRVRPIYEEEYVRKVYDSIAKQWHGTRYVWPKVKFIERQPKDLYLHIGCGNGRTGLPAPTYVADTVLVRLQHRALKICNGFGQEVRC